MLVTIVACGTGGGATAAIRLLQTSGYRMTTLASALDTKVLVLNRVYAALRVVDARRAFTMLVKDVAEVISIENGSYASYSFVSWTEAAGYQRQHEHDEHDWVLTSRFAIAVPKIVRLLGYDRFPKEHVKLNRRNIYARDGNRCQYCGRHFSTRELTLDHIRPRVQGGENSWLNLVCACVKCNARKGGRTPEQSGMRLMRTPVKPRRNPAITLRLGSPRYQSWKAFLDEAYWTVELTD